MELTQGLFQPGHVQVVPIEYERPIIGYGQCGLIGDEQSPPAGIVGVRDRAQYEPV